MKGSPGNFLPDEVIAMVAGQMTRFLAKRLTLRTKRFPEFH